MPSASSAAPPYHSREDQPVAVVAHQRVQGEDAAFAMVVGLHGQDHVFDGGQQRDRPDDQGQRADDEGLVHLGDAAVACQNGLHDVQRRGADVTVDDADGDEEHAELESLLLVHWGFHHTFLPFLTDGG